MNPRKAGGITTVVGVSVTAVPFLWGSVPEPIRDSIPGRILELLLHPIPLAGGMAPNYPVGLGMVAFGLGLCVTVIDEIERDPWTVLLVGAGIGAFFGMVLALMAIQGHAVETVALSLLGTAPGFVAVGAAGNGTTRQLVGVSLFILMLSPMVGWLLYIAAIAEGGAQIIIPVYLLDILLVTGVYSFPFLQLGQAFRKEQLSAS